MIGDAREVARGHQKDWSNKGQAEGCWSAQRESLLSAWRADIIRRCQSVRIGKLRFTPPKCPVCRGTEGKTRGEAEWL